MVETAITLRQYVGNNSDVTPYPTEFPFKENSWVRVSVLFPNGDEGILAEDDDYTITGAGDPGGGQIITSIPYDNTHTITIYRVVPLTQLLDLGYNERPPSQLIEDAFDKLTYIAQQLAGNTADPGRVIRFPVSEPASNNTLLPTPVNRRDSVVFFDTITGEMSVIRLSVLAQRLLVILGAEIVLPYRSVEISESMTITKFDVNTSFRVNSPDDVVITLPPTDEFYDEFFCGFSKFGGGAVTFEAAPGVVIDSDQDKVRIFGQKTEVVVQKIGVNRWWIRGDLY